MKEMSFEQGRFWENLVWKVAFVLLDILFITKIGFPIGEGEERWENNVFKN